MARTRKAAETAGPGLTPAPTGARTVFLLEPMDAWFFRDGRPFDADDPAQISMPSLFPPMPQTAIGAVRAALALALGWDGHADWTGNPAIQNAVGSDDRLGPLNGSVMSLVQITVTPPPASQPNAPRQRTIAPLFAAPPVLFGHLSTDENALPRRIVRLGLGRPRRCDLGTAVKLPAFDDDKDRECKPLAGKFWLTAAGMAVFLQGGVPQNTVAHIVSAAQIFKNEPRTGLALVRATRTAEPGMLYRVSYKRPLSGFGIALNAVRGPGGANTDLLRPVPFGGEGRMAWVSVHQGAAPALPTPPGNLARDRQTRKVRYTVTLMTPADLGGQWPLARLPGLPGTICSACIDRAVPVSGWRRRGTKQEARDSHAMIPAGATWFMEADAADERTILNAHGSAVGEQRHWGYGRILIGTWNEQGG